MKRYAHAAGEARRSGAKASSPAPSTAIVAVSPNAPAPKKARRGVEENKGSAADTESEADFMTYALAIVCNNFTKTCTENIPYTVYVSSHKANEFGMLLVFRVCACNAS